MIPNRKQRIRKREHDQDIEMFSNVAAKILKKGSSIFVLELVCPQYKQVTIYQICSNLFAKNLKNSAQTSHVFELF